jgi:hypothetical protein
MTWEYRHWRIVQKSKEEKCKLCHSNKNLVVHHIDRDLHNSHIDNLMTLCSSCHIKLHRCGRELTFITNYPKRDFPVHLTITEFDKKLKLVL